MKKKIVGTCIECAHANIHAQNEPCNSCYSRGKWEAPGTPYKPPKKEKKKGK